MKHRRWSGRDRAASEVISVLLMVSVTIVLAAMVGSVLLNVVGGVSDNPIAGASVTFDSENDEITVVFSATQKQGTTLEVKLLDASGTEVSSSPETIAEVGESATFSPSEGDYTVRVIAKAPDGERAVVLEKDGSI